MSSRKELLIQKKEWYKKNKAKLREHESSNLFHCYRNLRILLQKRSSEMTPAIKLVLENLKSDLAVELKLKSKENLNNKEFLVLKIPKSAIECVN